MDFVLGIDIGGTFTKLGLVDADRRLIGETRLETAAADGPDSLVGRLAVHARGFAREAVGRELSEVAAVGVGLAGLVEAASGVLVTGPNLAGWEGFAAASALRQALGIEQLVVENDASAGALAEAKIGAGRGRDPVVLITLGTGVGGGLVENGRIVHGRWGFAGEFGHMALAVDGGNPCACGATGCVESFLRAERVVALARERMAASAGAGAAASGPLARALAAGEATAATVGEAATRGDPVALAVFSELGRYLGAAVASVICAINPEVVVVGGGVARVGAPLLDAARATAQARLMSPLAGRTAILGAALGDRGGMLGAALMALAHLSSRRLSR
jgi:glucokinase